MCPELVVGEVHRPGLVGLEGNGLIREELRLHTAFGGLLR
jgi:hypothetical protein